MMSGQARSQEGGELASSYEAFYQAQYPGAVRLAWLLTHSSDACEDLAQEALVAVYSQFGELERPLAYMRQVVVNRCRAWHKKEMRRRQSSAPLREQHAEMPVPDPQLLEAISRLPYRQRMVIVARYWGDWSEADIAAALNCRPGTVKSLLSRATDRLRKEVDR